MRGVIHGIWFVQPGSKIHPQVIPHLESWINDAKLNDFAVALWTNTKDLASEDLARLQGSKILVMDYTACKDSPLYEYFTYFYQLGFNGDKTALALASDIFRVVLLDLTEDEQYFIYIDPNDVTLSDLKNSLANLDKLMQNNNFGFSFTIDEGRDPNSFDLRNDVLIALKKKNLAFFKDYLQSYWFHVDKTYKLYVKPTTDSHAKLQAALISNQITGAFFNINFFNDNTTRVVAQFGNYVELCQAVNSHTYLKSARDVINGNSWLPAEYSTHKELTSSPVYANFMHNYHNPGLVIILSLIVLSIILGWLKNKWGSWRFKSII